MADQPPLPMGKPALSAIAEEVAKSTPEPASTPAPAAPLAAAAADNPPLTPDAEKPKDAEAKNDSKGSTDAIPPTPGIEQPANPLAIPGLTPATAGAAPINPFSPPFKFEHLLSPLGAAAAGLGGTPMSTSDALALRYAELGLPSAAQHMSLLEFERHKEVLRKSHELLDKVCPTRLIPPREYKFFITHLSRNLAQNTLDRGVQTNPERSKRYRDSVEWCLKEMYPLLRPALGIIGKEVEEARLESEEGMGDARIEEKTLKFEAAVIKRIQEVEEKENFEHTDIEGRNLNKELVEDLRRKLQRRIEHRRTRSAGRAENSTISVGEVEKLLADTKKQVVTDEKVGEAGVA